MKITLLAALLAVVALSGCEKTSTNPPVVVTPAPVTVAAGAPGAPGAPGNAGNPGAPGATGDTGAAGATGVAGDKGDTGKTGAPGKEGDTIIVVPEKK